VYSGIARVALFAGLALMLSHRASAEISDPMRPPDYRSADASKRSGPARPHFSLTSTLISPERRVAVINGRRVSVGGRVDGARVLAIGSSEVRLRAGGHTYTVRMLPHGIKTPAAAGDDLGGKR
jgi:MSHA biogenesis protein MshK